MALMKRLSSDRSIAPMVAQFVPLKITTNGPQWQKWASKYRHEGRAIPIIYIVRADGKMLYGKSGSLSGNALPQLLLLSMRNAGRVFNNKEMTLLVKAVENAKKAQAEGDTFATVKAISVVKKFGTPGKLNSHAKIAIEADQLVQKLNEEARAALEAAEAKLAEDNNSFEGAIALVEVNRNYSMLPSLKIELSKAMRAHEKDESLRDLIKQATFLNRAQTQARSKKTERRGLESLKRVISRYPDSPAATVAIATYKELTGKEPMVDVTASKPAAGDKTKLSEFRIWTDSTGKYRIKARLLEIKGKVVVLEKEDGTTTNVPLEKLCNQDREFCRKIIDLDL